MSCVAKPLSVDSRLLLAPMSTPGPLKVALAAVGPQTESSVGTGLSPSSAEGNTVPSTSTFLPSTFLEDRKAVEVQVTASGFPSGLVCCVGLPA